jgi:hypothetical protein
MALWRLFLRRNIWKSIIETESVKNVNDTPPEIEKRMADMIALRTPSERLRMASSMFDMARKLMEAGIRHENPSIDETELRARMFLRLYRDDFSKDEMKKIIKHLFNREYDSLK